MAVESVDGIVGTRTPTENVLRGVGPEAVAMHVHYIYMLPDAIHQIPTAIAEEGETN